MIYWHISFWFFLLAFSGCMYSMSVHEEDLDLLSGILERAGICFVLAVAWPLSMMAVIALAVSEFLPGGNHGEERE